MTFKKLKQIYIFKLNQSRIDLEPIVNFNICILNLTVTIQKNKNFNQNKLKLTYFMIF